MAEYIEQKSADSEKVHKMISIQSRFHGECEARSPPSLLQCIALPLSSSLFVLLISFPLRLPTQQSLIDPGRVFIREAQLLGWNVKNKRKQIYVVFLFNDLLVLARPMKVCTACFVCAV